MSLISLDDHSAYVPRLDHLWLNDILVPEIEAFDSVEQVDLFHLLFFLTQLLHAIVIFWRPVLKLEYLA